jgi:hypothetical protein
MSALVIILPSPVGGVGWGGGREVVLSKDGCKKSSNSMHYLPTSTPNPSPQGGGES